MFREVRTSERITDRCEKKQTSEEYRKIKPETEMTIDEAKAYWDSLFAGMVES